MTMLSVDPSDPNLWFSQLLARRSSGIEGLQEFTAVVVVPRDEGFCVNARLRRVCVLDAPPGPLDFDERFNLQQHLGRLLNYLDRAYPPGTPLEEFDVDLIEALPKPAPPPPNTPPPPERFTRPVLEFFWVAGFVMVAHVISPTPSTVPGSIARALVNFKTHLELWLETLRDEYEREVARSPLERGVLMGEERILDTCFAFSAANGGFAVSGSNASVGPLQRIRVDRHDFDIGGITTTASSARKTTRERAYEAVTRWNLLENRLAILLCNRLRRHARKPSHSMRMSCSRSSKSGPDCPPMTRTTSLSLTPSRRCTSTTGNAGLLQSAGARDLRSIAEAIRSTPIIDRYNEGARERGGILQGGEARRSCTRAGAMAALSKGCNSDAEGDWRRALASVSTRRPRRRRDPGRVADIALRMARRRQVFNRLALGPLVGHTDETSTRIWIQVFDEPANYQLRVYGRRPLRLPEHRGKRARVPHGDRHGVRPPARSALPL